MSACVTDVRDSKTLAEVQVYRLVVIRKLLGRVALNDGALVASRLVLFIVYGPNGAHNFRSSLILGFLVISQNLGPCRAYRVLQGGGSRAGMQPKVP